MKKGFTLIEMIGVMVIISLLLLLVMPNIINYIKKGGDIKDKATKEILYTAAKKFMEDNKEDFKKDKYSTYCIKVNILSNEGYIDSPMTLSSSDKDITNNNSTTSVKITYDKKYKYDLVENCEEKINPTPVLSKGLTPIKYDEENSKWIVADKDKNDWYDYDKQEWANAVTLLPGVTKNVGDEVKVDGTEASMMLVWIPRYEYKIEGIYGKSLYNEEETQTRPGAININFVLRTKKGYDSVSGYRVHPAFTFGEQEVSGIWVGKFEISSADTSANLDKIRVLPNMVALSNMNISSFFTLIRNLENESTLGLKNIDTHMIKNSEWGAVAYLSQSKYGKYGNKAYENENREVYENKSYDFLTGKSNGTPSPIEERSGDQCSYNDMTALGDGKGVCGPGASTTGNIYGVYDMSGGSYEFVMGVLSDNDGIYIGYKIDPPWHSFFNGRVTFTNQIVTGWVPQPEEKYYDKYNRAENNIVCVNEVDNTCYGQALTETMNWYNNNNSNNDDSRYYPWILRSGSYIDSDEGIHNGIFQIIFSYGVGDFTSSTRPVFISK